MAEKDKVKGIMSKKKKVTVVPVPYCPENRRISKAQFILNRAKRKAANKAADEARAKSLASHGVTQGEAEANDAKEALQKKVASLKDEIKVTKEAYSKNPESKRTGNRLQKLAEKLDEAENELDELEQ